MIEGIDILEVIEDWLYDGGLSISSGVNSCTIENGNVIINEENDEVICVLNTYHRIWLSINRKVIAGTAESLFEKIDMVLTGYLEEQREYEKMDMMEDGM